MKLQFGDLQGILSSRLLKKLDTAAAAGLTVVLVWLRMVDRRLVGCRGAGVGEAPEGSG